MTRRAVLATLILGLFAAPLAVEAQQAGRTLPRVAIVCVACPKTEMMIGPEPVNPHYRAFVQALRDLGWRDGQTVEIVRRAAEGKFERGPVILAELVGQNVDVIVTTNRFARDARVATKTIPIVIASGADLVGQGLAASLSRPGGNLTGMDLQDSPELNAKRLQLLREAVPEVARVAVLLGGPMAVAWASPLQSLVRELGITLVGIPVRSEDQLVAAFGAVTRDRVQALQAWGTFFYKRPLPEQIADFALRSRLPTVADDRMFVEAGQLLSYGPSLFAAFQKAAVYVDRILRGARPGDLPIEQPTKFELVINRASRES